MGFNSGFKGLSTPEEGAVECSRSPAVNSEFLELLCLCVCLFRTLELLAFHVHMPRLYCCARLRSSYQTLTGRFHSLYYAVTTGRCLSTFRSILSSLSARSAPERQNPRDLYQLSRCIMGHTVARLVDALRYKSEGRGFDSRCCHWNVSLT